MPVEVLLQPLIWIVYKHLLKAVLLKKWRACYDKQMQNCVWQTYGRVNQNSYLKRLEPAYINDADRSVNMVFSHLKWLVYLFDKPVKQTSIDKFRQSISSVNCLREQENKQDFITFIRECFLILEKYTLHVSNKHTCCKVHFLAMLSSPALFLCLDNDSFRSWVLQPISFAAVVTAAQKKNYRSYFHIVHLLIP